MTLDQKSFLQRHKTWWHRLDRFAAIIYGIKGVLVILKTKIHE